MKVIDPPSLTPDQWQAQLDAKMQSHSARIAREIDELRSAKQKRRSERAAEYGRRNRGRPPMRNRKAVIDMNSGERWESITECAKALGVVRPAVVQSVQKGWGCRGRILCLEGQQAVRRPSRRSRPVRCVETGQVFQHCSDAARAFGLRSRSAIWTAINMRKATISGLHWEYAA